MIFFLVAFLLIIGAGFAFGMVAMLLAVALVALGILSSSVLVGTLRRSVSAGVVTLLTLTLAAVGAPAGIAAVWIAKSFLQTEHLSVGSVILGALGGVTAGLCITGMFVWTAKAGLRLAREQIARLQQDHAR